MQLFRCVSKSLLCWPLRVVTFRWRFLEPTLFDGSLFSFANLPVQFRSKKTTHLPFLDVFTTMTHVRSQMYKRCLTILAMFLRYDKMCVTLLTKPDYGRYVNNLQLGETTIGTWQFLQLHETTIDSIPRNNRTSFQIISAKLKCSVKCDANTLIVFIIPQCLHRVKNCVLVSQRTR